MKSNQYIKTVFQLLFLLFFCTPLIYAQKTVDQIFTKSNTQTISLDYQDLFTKSTAFTQSIDLGEYGTYQLSLEQTNLFSDGYLERKASKTDDVTKLPLTFRGTIQGQPNTLVSLTTNEGFLSGFIDNGEDVIFFEPYKNFDVDAVENELIIYYQRDVIDQGHSCASNHTDQQSTQVMPQNDQFKNAMTGCYEVEMVLVADYAMYQKHGSSTLNHIISVLNNVQTNYDTEFNDPITFVVVDNYIATNSSMDLWSGTTNASALLDEFETSNISNLAYDLASLWVTRNIWGLDQNGNVNNSVVGLANRPGVCGNRYNLIEDFNGASATDLRVLLAHEIGHNFSATHDATSGYIMSPSLNNTSTWSTQSLNEINAFYPTATCLCASGDNADLSFRSCGSTAINGNTLTISDVEVRNGGTMGNSTFKVGWYLSSDNNITTNDYLTTTKNGAALNPGQYATFFPFTIDLNNVNVPDGNYYLGLIIDYENTIVEFSDENNIGCVSSSPNITIGTPIPEPDLIISSKSVSSNTVACGGSITGFATVKNDGDASAGSHSYLRYYLSTNSTWESSDTYLGYDYVNNLAANETGDENATLAIPAGLTPGTYYILFSVDHSNQVSESNENNNVAFQQITLTCTPEPDLIISSKSVSSNTVACGNSITGYATVKNDGSNTASGSYLYYYLSTDAVLDNTDTELAWDIIGNLGVNAVSTQNESLSIPDDLSAGTYYILFVTDPQNFVAESNENNNVAFQQITVTCAPEPDLIISSKSVSSNTVACGNSITGYATVKNDGSSTASGSYLYYYLSTDAVLDNSDAVLAWDIIGNLGVNAVSIQNESLLIPDDLNAGTYYILFVTDPQNFVAESDENNNVAFEQITVTCTAASIIGEQGNVTISQSNSSLWTTVTLNNTYTNPVVVMGPISFAGAHQSTMNIRNVTSNSFQCQVDEWDYLDGGHAPETIGYMVVEAGTHTLSNGATLTAGNFSLSSTAWLTLGYGAAGFTTPPIVMTQNCGSNGGHANAVTTRVKNVTTGSFQIKLQEEENNDQVHSSGRVAFIAVESGTSNGTEKFEVNKSADNVTHTWRVLNFSQSYTNPVFLAKTQTADGGDPMALRYRNLASTSAQVKCEEEKSKNTEVAHTTEVVGWMVFDTPGNITTAAGSNLIANEETETIQEVEEELKVDETVALSIRNYPNPFSGYTTIEYTLTADSPVTLTVLDLNGRQIAVLVDGKPQTKGTYTATFDGNSYPAGMYYYTIRAGEYVGTQKMILAK